MIALSTEQDGLQENEDLLCLEFVDGGVSRKLRDIMLFAEEEIILPSDGGPFEGQPFEGARQPYVRLLYNEVMHGNWSEYIITGPSQSGKTLCAFVIILLWILVELRKNCVCGVPDGNMIADKWEVDIEPVFRASPKLEQLLPKSGPGSKGGAVKEFVKLENGVRLRFMTAGGSDQSKAGFTATHMAITEAAGFSGGKKQSTSKEAGALRQLRARQRSASRFDDEGRLTKDRQMFVEGTVTDEFDLPWVAFEGSSKSRIVHKCPFCRKWVSMEREHLSNFENAETELAAARQAYFCCSECGESIDEDVRRVMVEDCELLHEGQTITQGGKIKGDIPETATLFFRWSGFQNLFLKISDLAAEEWRAKQLDPGSHEFEEAEKELCQQVWCIPFRPLFEDEAPLEAKDVRRRTSRLTTGVIPELTEHLVFGVDVGRYRCWYFAIAFCSDGTLHCPLYGAMDTSLLKGGKIQPIHEKAAIKNALREIYDMVLAGWPMVGQSELRSHDLTLTDGGYMPDAVQEVQAEYGRGMKSKFKMIDGIGKSEMASRLYSNPKRPTSITRKISKPPGLWHLDYRNGGWVLILNADRAKLGIQNCLRVEAGQPGSLTLPLAPQREHTTVARHLSSEVYRRWIEPGKGPKEEWVKSGANHLLDSGAYAWIGGNYLGWRLPTPKKEKQETSKDVGSWLAEKLRIKKANK